MFQEHIKLEETKYGFISAQQFKDYVSWKNKISKNIKILLTIDDSLKVFKDNDGQYLSKKIPFILFVNTRGVNINHPKLYDMGTDQRIEKKRPCYNRRA